MKNPKLIHKKRLKRKPIAARHLAHERDIRYLNSLPKPLRIKVLKERIHKARVAKTLERIARRKKNKSLPVSPTPTNKPIEI